jgi:hypothetical protein
MNCIMIITCVELVPYPGSFIQKVQTWYKEIFVSAWGQPIDFLTKFLILPCFCPLQMVTYLTAWISNMFHLDSAFNWQHNPSKIALLAYADKMWLHYTTDNQEYLNDWYMFTVISLCISLFTTMSFLFASLYPTWKYKTV